ncbi:hypothetical protein CDV31_007711 [Fusarium ambrosium]|uniref:Uncharacterized protein n=1 Tax=Fusarium ambrosium TaxID=131363 RepID=A0A428U553_9HYPO|nr:hypothetical protein CDV31_007711 [Fusarium ambrosium]
MGSLDTLLSTGQQGSIGSRVVTVDYIHRNLRFARYPRSLPSLKPPKIKATATACAAHRMHLPGCAPRVTCRQGSTVPPAVNRQRKTPPPFLSRVCRRRRVGVDIHFPLVRHHEFIRPCLARLSAVSVDRRGPSSTRLLGSFR